MDYFSELDVLLEHLVYHFQIFAIHDCPLWPNWVGDNGGDCGDLVGTAKSRMALPGPLRPKKSVTARDA